MTDEEICSVLRRYKQGSISEREAAAFLGKSSVEEMGFAEIDHARERRQGFPEVIYGEGKTGEQVFAIMGSLAEKSEGSVMATRVSAEKAAFVQKKLSETVYDEVSRILYIERPVARDPERMILILSAGTSDIPVAEEARLTAHLCGNTVKVHYDCGVAGIHRLFAHKADIDAARVIVVIAGMEGALASVVGGLTDKPVIAVPTSVGYGAAFHGVTALLAMLSSCAAGVSVVNIDNGFGAGVLASKINHLR
uniref:nickel pincer cofactor biosynthesis protein LarB n=1 Tax=Mitsuokella multacida TaxID=52226 RepID=UPI0040262A22